MLIIQEKLKNIKGARFHKNTEFKDNQAEECIAHLHYLRSLSKHYEYRVICK